MENGNLGDVGGILPFGVDRVNGLRDCYNLNWGWRFVEGGDCMCGLKRHIRVRLMKKKERLTKICGHGTCYCQYRTRRLDRFQSIAPCNGNTKSTRVGHKRCYLYSKDENQKTARSTVQDLRTQLIVVWFLFLILFLLTRTTRKRYTRAVYDGDG